MGALLALSLLTACSGSSDDEPTIKPTSDAPSTAAAPPDPDGLTPEQREVVDAVEAYGAAIIGRGNAPIGPVIKDLVTQDVYDFIVPAETENVEDAGLQYIGQTTLTPTKVTITGDTATVQGCDDGSAAFLVKKGETSAGVGSQPVSTTKINFGLVREGDRWIISDPESTVVSAC
ncbi:MAG: hypothetical protein ABWX74_20355 [Aeromicrobium sp.]